MDRFESLTEMVPDNIEKCGWEKNTGYNNHWYRKVYHGTYYLYYTEWGSNNKKIWVVKYNSARYYRGEIPDISTLKLLTKLMNIDDK